VSPVEFIQPAAILGDVGTGDVDDRVEQGHSLGQHLRDILTTLHSHLAEASISSSVNLKGAADQVHAGRIARLVGLSRRSHKLRTPARTIRHRGTGTGTAPSLPCNGAGIDNRIIIYYDPVFNLWKSIMDELLEMRRNLSLWKDEISAIKREFIFRRLMRAATKAGFNEDEPRDERGRWTSEGGVEVTTSSGFLTGIPEIDQTSQALSDTLVRVMEWLDYLPSMSPSQYGTAVHGAFGLSLWWQDLPGVGDIERSFSLDTVDPYYGMAGTIRTDATLRNVQGDVIAIYDV
jgi:hypothetical protein